MTAPGARAEIAAVVGEAMAGAEPAAEQLDWLPPLRRDVSDGRRAAIAEGVRARGRPLGAKNIATRQALDFFRRVFGDPLIEQGRWLMLSPDELASAIGCTTAEAFDRQVAIRADLVRFFYAPLAAVDSNGNAVVPTFTMTIGGAPAAPGGDREPWRYLELIEQKTQQIRGVSEGDDPVSHAAVSHETPK